jgi:glyoxylase-like metal-dependent hydrolase (beta-lactamase superfamily II)
MNTKEESPLRCAIVTVTPFQQNCSILWDEETKRAAVIDPGGDVPRITGAISQLGVTVERILLTHGHIDHAGGAAELAEALDNLPIEGPDQRDRFLLEGLAAQASGFGFAGVRNVTPTCWLHEGDQVSVAGHQFDVLHCPGHTPGHVVFVNQAARFAIVGDVLFSGSVGRTDFPYGDHDALIGAIRDKLLPFGDDIAFVCGHGPGSTIGTERRDNPFLRGLGASP